jgi:protein-S-isoprenylcysteine O-methyltransferase Ste14
MNRCQIAPEERALQALFGAEFERYCSQVRRWL